MYGNQTHVYKGYKLQASRMDFSKGSHQLWLELMKRRLSLSTEK